MICARWTRQRPVKRPGRVGPWPSRSARSSTRGPGGGQRLLAGEDDAAVDDPGADRRDLAGEHRDHREVKERQPSRSLPRRIRVPPCANAPSETRSGSPKRCPPRPPRRRWPQHGPARRPPPARRPRDEEDSRARRSRSPRARAAAPAEPAAGLPEITVSGEVTRSRRAPRRRSRSSASRCARGLLEEPRNSRSAPSMYAEVASSSTSAGSSGAERSAAVSPA